MAGTLYTSGAHQSLRSVLPDLWRARELLRALFWKDVRVRYRNAAIGLVWALLQPLAMTLILYFVFSLVFAARLREAGAPGGPAYAVSILCALIPWQFFSSGLIAATQSLVDNQNLIKKVHFPREIIPLTALGNPLITVVIGFALVLAVYSAVVGAPGGALLGWALVFGIQCVLMFGLALLLSCAQVYSRDVQFLVEVLMTFGFYASPIFYTLDMVRGAAQGLESAALSSWLVPAYLANPMAGLITAYRACLFENRLPGVDLLAWPALLACGVLVLGLMVFRRRAATFADHL